MACFDVASGRAELRRYPCSSSPAALGCQSAAILRNRFEQVSSSARAVCRQSRMSRSRITASARHATPAELVQGLCFPSRQHVSGWEGRYCTRSCRWSKPGATQQYGTVLAVQSVLWPDGRVGMRTRPTSMLRLRDATLAKWPIYRVQPCRSRRDILEPHSRRLPDDTG